MTKFKDEKKTVTGTDGDEIRIDLSNYPIVTALWLGAPTEKLVRDFYAYRKTVTDHAHANGTQVVMVNDLNNAKAPTATTRKLASDFASNDNTTPGFSHQVNIVTNPLVRGALTAIEWVGGKDKIRVVYANDWEDALNKAVQSYIDRGVEPPAVDPARYKFPSM